MSLSSHLSSLVTDTDTLQGCFRSASWLRRHRWHLRFHGVHAARDSDVSHRYLGRNRGAAVSHYILMRHGVLLLDPKQESRPWRDCDRGPGRVQIYVLDVALIFVTRPTGSRDVPRQISDSKSASSFKNARNLTLHQGFPSPSPSRASVATLHA